MNELNEQFESKGLTIIGVTGEGKGDTEKWVESKGAEYPYGYDKGGKIRSYFGVTGIPHAVLIDPTGTIVWRGNPGGLSNATIEASLGGALAEPLWKWPDAAKKVRQALQACINHSQVLDLAYRGKGVAGEDHHVAPIHPEYFKLPAMKPDVEKAKALLKEAGHAGGLQLAIDCNNAAKWEVDAVQAMVEMWKPAGISVKINVMPGTQYWENWTKTPFGMTSWTHRPLGVMVLNLAYRTGVPWNETKYTNPAFEKALDEATGTLDATERRKKMERVQKILQDDAVIMQPLWRSVFSAGSAKVHNMKQHPTSYYQFNQVWVG